MRRSNFVTLLYLLVVFASGAMVGGFANRLYMAKTVTATVNAPPSRAELRKQYIQDMRSRLRQAIELSAKNGIALTADHGRRINGDGGCPRLNVASGGGIDLRAPDDHLARRQHQ